MTRRRKSQTDQLPSRQPEPDARPHPEGPDQPAVRSRRALLSAGGPLGLGLGALGVIAASSATATPAHADPSTTTTAADPIAEIGWHNVTDFGLPGNGKGDCGAALRALLRDLGSNPATLYFPRGTYRFRSAVGIPRTATVLLDHGAMLAPDEGITVTINGPVDAGPTQIFDGAGTIDGPLGGDWLLPQWWGALGDGKHDDTAALQSALDLARRENGGAVYLSRGRYKITTGLRIFRNTNVKLHHAATIVRHHDGDFFLNGTEGEMYPGYSGHGNILIEGGTLDGNIVDFPDAFVAMSFGHASNITIRDLTIKDVSWGHAIEVNATEDVLIANCRFTGYLRPVDGSRDFSEAVQIDVPTRLSFPAFGPWDGTPSQHITVRDCYFGPSGTAGTEPWPCGVGTHGGIHDVWARDIRVLDNTFDRLTYWAVRLFKWNDCVVSGNTLYRCGGGIAVSTPSPNSESTKDKDGVQQGVSQAGQRVQIVGNLINGTTKSAAIGLYGRDQVFHQDTLIQANQIFDVGNSQSAIRASWAQGLRVVGNLVRNARRGVELDNCRDVRLGDNTIAEIAVNGIEGTALNAVCIAGNAVRDCAFYGMSISRMEDFLIERNRIADVSHQEDSRYDAILLSEGCRSGQVRENTVRIGAGKGRYGLQITSACAEIETSNNLLEGKAAAYRNDSDSTVDQLSLYAPDGRRFRVQVGTDGALTATAAD